jgi:hypothetical protein
VFAPPLNRQGGHGLKLLGQATLAPQQIDPQLLKPIQLSAASNLSQPRGGIG